MARPTVLIVEPREALRDQLRDHLEHKFDVLVARTPSGALTGLSRQRPEAVLIGMDQGDDDGFSLAQRVRDHGVGLPPFVVVYGPAPDLAAGVDLKARYGVDRHLATGVTARQLDSVLADKFRAGWQAARAIANPETRDDPRWSNPMLGTDAVSARNAEEPEKKGFSLKRLFGRG